MPAQHERAQVEDSLQLFQAFWLEPAEMAPPAIDQGAKQVDSEGLHMRVEPVLAEDATWNQWPGPTARLFNNRAAYLFQVHVEHDGPLRWLPETTGLELNVEGDPLPAAMSPEDLLTPLLGAALDQERYVLEGDLVERTRAAGPFRARYLPVIIQEQALDGLIAFPLRDPELHVGGLRLTIGIEDSLGPRSLEVVYD